MKEYLVGLEPDHCIVMTIYAILKGRSKNQHSMKLMPVMSLQVSHFIIDSMFMKGMHLYAVSG